MNHVGQIRWDWTPELWPWNPVRHGWTPSQGLPQVPCYLEVSTDGIPPSQAYEFWSDTVFHYPRTDVPDGAARRAFDGRIRALAAVAGDFCEYRSDTLALRRTAARQRADDGDDVDIGLVLSGRYLQEQGQAIAVAANGFFCTDLARPSRIVLNRCHGLHLSLRRPVLEAALGGSVPDSADIANLLARSPVADLLREQLRATAGRMGTLPVGPRAALLEQTVELTLFALSAGVYGAGAHGQRRGLLVAALRHIERHLADPELSAAPIAHALNCSRATLYRAFADAGLTIAGVIRERRLLRARQCLQRIPHGRTIGDVAAACGFFERRSFNRLFRERFDARPGDVAARISPS